MNNTSNTFTSQANFEILIKIQIRYVLIKI